MFGSVAASVTGVEEFWKIEMLVPVTTGAPLMTVTFAVAVRVPFGSVPENVYATVPVVAGVTVTLPIGPESVPGAGEMLAVNGEP